MSRWAPCSVSRDAVLERTWTATPSLRPVVRTSDPDVCSPCCHDAGCPGNNTAPVSQSVNVNKYFSLNKVSGPFCIKRVFIFLLFSFLHEMLFDINETYRRNLKVVINFKHCGGSCYSTVWNSINNKIDCEIMLKLFFRKLLTDKLWQICSKIRFKVVFSAFCTALDLSLSRSGTRKWEMVTSRESLTKIFR